MFYMIGCTYVDQDGSQNQDNTVQEFTDKAEAQAFASTLKSEADIIDVWITESDSPL